jgi:hypothetical protein
MLGDMAKAQPQLLWRDFWATHDPASSGPIVFPIGMSDPGAPRFLGERVYNRMRISEDHNVFWDNDEHYLIPLIREIDAVTSDRSARPSTAMPPNPRSGRRKERVALLALWRRATLAMPVMAILAAMLVTAGGASTRRPASRCRHSSRSRSTMELVSAGGRSTRSATRRSRPGCPSLHLAALVRPRRVRPPARVHGPLVLVVVPGRPDRLWLGRPTARAVLLAFDIAIGAGALAVIAFAWLVTARPDGRSAGWSARHGLGLPGLVGIGLVFVGIGQLRNRVRSTIADLDGRTAYADRSCATR